jgi:hydrogenase nickel incorporation protein HypA/HybF
MHEMAVAEGILSVALEASRGVKVKSIGVSIGKLQHLTQDSLQFSFTLIAEETPASGATIEITHIPARFHCKQCGADFDFGQGALLCMECNGVDLDVLTGSELIVDFVALENGDVIRRKPVSVQESLDKHIREDHGVDANHHHED